MTDPNAAEILHTGLDSLIDDAKASEDFSKEVTELLSTKVSQLEASNRIDEAVEHILVLEKKCRQVSDAISCSKLCNKIIEMYYQQYLKQSDVLQKTLDMMVILSKKRGQLRRTISNMITLGANWLKAMKEGGKDHTQLLNTLLDITDGKIFVEVERSRLVSIQARIKEEIEGDIDGAAMLLQETQVETFSTMDKIEKSRFILNQMRLMLLRHDYVRVQIASRKISEKFLSDEDMQEIKVEYLLYMIKYYLFGEAQFNTTDNSNSKKSSEVKSKIPNNDGSGNFYEVTRCYQKIFDTKIVKALEVSEKVADKSKCNVCIPSWREVLSHWLIYCVLAKHNENSVKLMEDTCTLLSRKELEVFENLSGLVKSFREKKLISWPLKFEPELLQHQVFKEPVQGPIRLQLLRKRVIQHNLKICSLYYSRISTDRLMQLLSLTQKEVESELAALVVDGTLYARIDRPERLIVFGHDKKPEDQMNGWSTSIENVLNLVKECGHLIGKEKMIQDAQSKMKAVK